MNNWLSGTDSNESIATEILSDMSVPYVRGLVKVRFGFMACDDVRQKKGIISKLIKAWQA